MREPRNPFMIRTAEQINNFELFLRLFSPGTLNLLSQKNFQERLQIIRSAPGGGKTSILKIFMPRSLLNIYGLRANEDYKIIYQKMNELGVISNRGPKLLGIMLSCARNYAVLEDLNLNSTQKERLLYSLINSRLIIAMLREALVLNDLEYPKDLEKLLLKRPEDTDFPTEIPVPGTGKDLNDWATSIERNVCETIDSFGPYQSKGMKGHDTLYSLLLMRPENITYDCKPICSSMIVMLDDFHQLTRNQRKKMLSRLITLRPPLGVWIAERLEALETQELLDPGSNVGREYGEPIILESYWRHSSSSKSFENIVRNIAERRAKLTYDNQSFNECLQESLDIPLWNKKYEEIIKVISSRVYEKIQSSKKYENWIKKAEEVRNFNGTPREHAIEWRAFEILIERANKKGQLTLDLTLLEDDSQETKDLSRVRSTAEYFISREFNIPYYFGMSRLANLSSSNIVQFLSFAGELFEEIISTALLKKSKSTLISANRQESILVKVAKEKWEDIPRGIPNGRVVQRFLDTIGELSLKDTEKPNAPYVPGVTGIAITMEERDILVESMVSKKYQEYQKLSHVISACISNNLLEASIDRKQGGKKWMVLYLNRWLCLYFGLPLNYGGWRGQKISEMTTWLENTSNNLKKESRAK